MRFWSVCLLLFAGVLAVSSAEAASRLTVESLRCEYRQDPLGVEERAPRLSWQLHSADRGIQQAAYRVLAATDPRDLQEDRADLWDSGPVSSGDSTQVVYRGKPLSTGQTCFWKVRVWDQDGRSSEYSHEARWEMGLLESKAWDGSSWIGLPESGGSAAALRLDGAHWVWYPEGNPARLAPPGIRYFRRVVAIRKDAPVRKAVFLLAVDNSATLAVNGHAAGQAAGWQSGQKVDVASLLIPGQNVFAVAATNIDGPAGLLGRLAVSYEDGKSETTDIDGTWKTSQREEAGWEALAFADARWQPAMTIARLGDAPWGQVGVSPDASPCTYLHKAFIADGGISRARAYVSALGTYELHLNGRRVGDELLAPGWTDYRIRAQYQTYDVTGLVRSGDNMIGAIVGDGWYSGALGWALERNNFGPGPDRLRVVLRIEYRDGKVASITTDGSWTGSVGPILESDLYGGEIYDARRELDSWDRPGGSVGNWKSVTVYQTPAPELHAQSDPPIRITEELHPVAITEPATGVYVFDLGQNMPGVARLKVRGAAGTRVVLRYGELLKPDGTVYRENLRAARAIDEYVLSGHGAEVFTPHFTYHGFRYVEVTGYPGKPSLDALTGLVFHSDLDRTSHFETSNELVNHLFWNITWGQRANLMSVPTDCPQRDERLGWMGDAEIFARSACWNMDMAPFFTKWMRDIVDAQSQQGAFSDVSPRVIDTSDGAPAWADAGIVVPWTVYECYGDTRILERNYPAMRRYVELLHDANPENLWLHRRNHDFGDWVAASEATSKDLIASAFYGYDTRLLSRMAKAVGRDADARRYTELADRIATAYNQRFLSADGHYEGDTQTAYAMSLEMGLVPANRRAQVGERLAENVRRHGVQLTTGFIGTALLLPALTDTGHADLAFQLLTRTQYPSWGYMIQKGATTIWELWNSDSQGPAMNSRNHSAFGTVAEWMQRYLAGIDLDPDQPGYRHARLHPTPGGDLTHVRCDYDSIYGDFGSEWRLDGTRFTWNVRIPANTTATLVFPGSSASSVVQEGGKPVWSENAFHRGVSGITACSLRSVGIELGVGSGSYSFVLVNSARGTASPAGK